MHDVVVVGAGLAGLTAAADLAAQGRTVRVVEATSRAGGRLRSIEVGGVRADAGAAFFTARDPAFRSCIGSLAEAGMVAPWADRLHAWEDGALRAEPLSGGERRWAAPDGLDALARRLARGLDVRFDAPVRGLISAAGRWRVLLGGGGEEEAAVVVLAVPAPQAASLASSAGDAVDASLIEAIGQTITEPCLTVVAAFDAPPPPWRGIASESGPVRWIGLESSKRPAARTCVAVHADADASRRWWELPDDEAARALLDEAAAIGGDFLLEPRAFEVVRWREARPSVLAASRALVSERGGQLLVVCGDWCHSPRVEGAWLSGMAAAERVLVSDRV